VFGSADGDRKFTQTCFVSSPVLCGDGGLDDDDDGDDGGVRDGRKQKSSDIDITSSEQDLVASRERIYKCKDDYGDHTYIIPSVAG
jgi:hypothetical protein